MSGVLPKLFDHSGDKGWAEVKVGQPHQQFAFDVSLLPCLGDDFRPRGADSRLLQNFLVVDHPDKALAEMLFEALHRLEADAFYRVTAQPCEDRLRCPR